MENTTDHNYENIVNDINHNLLIAIEVPEHVGIHITTHFRDNDFDNNFRRTNVDQFHITLAIPGRVYHLQSIYNSLNNVALPVGFPLTLTKLVAIPFDSNASHACLLTNPESRQSMQTLYETIINALQAAGIYSDVSVPYQPHCTIATNIRFERGPTPITRKTCTSNRNYRSPEFMVTRVHLYNTTRVPRNGYRYDVLYTFPPE